MKTTAAVLWEQGQPLSIEEAELPEPRAGEVLVEIKSAGVCHSDLHPARGDWPVRTPLVLGHEGAGIVRAVGENVTKVKASDHVVFCWAPACGVCPPCRENRPVLCDRLERTTYRNRLPAGDTVLTARGEKVAHFNGTACFADFAIVAEEGAVAVDADVPFDVLATLGCAVITGVGAVWNTAQAKAGETVVVIGAGGVGLNVIQAAKISECAPVIAIDLHTSALQLARDFGATETIQADDAKAVVKQVRALTDGRGAHYVFDTVGSPATIAQALDCARKGGAVVLTGLSRVDALANVPVFPFVMSEKRLLGSLYGSGQPTLEIPRLVELYKQGKLKLRELVTHTYQLNEINAALEKLAVGGSARGIIQW